MTVTRGAQALRPYVPEILSTLQQAAAADNEEIALLCLRVVFDLYKNFRPAPDEQIKNLCELVHQVSRRVGPSCRFSYTRAGSPTQSLSRCCASNMVALRPPMYPSLLCQLLLRRNLCRTHYIHVWHCVFTMHTLW